MIVKMFKPQFAALVASGKKKQTVRPWPKKLPRVGDNISLRYWTGLPYRSKQEIAGTSIILSVEPVTLEADSVSIDGRLLSPWQLDTFARLDGFADFAALVAWFTGEHGLPFTGILIKWQ